MMVCAGERSSWITAPACGCVRGSACNREADLAILIVGEHAEVRGLHVDLDATLDELLHVLRCKGSAALPAALVLAANTCGA